MEKGQDIVFIVLFGAIVMLGIALVVIFFVATHRKKYLLQQNEIQRAGYEKEQAVLLAIISAQEDERNRIAHNLHDSVGAELSMVKLNLSKQLYFLNSSETIKQEFLNELNNLDQTIESIALVCKDLYPLTLQNHGIIETINQLVTRLNSVGAVQCSFNCSLKESDLDLSYKDTLNLFRVFQEVLNNVIKHSVSTNISIVLNITNNATNLRFSHNGIKFTNVSVLQFLERNKGLGLSGIQNRINLLKGEINYSADNHGTNIVIELPKHNVR